MKHLRALLSLALGLSVLSSPVLAAGGGKASTQHAQAKAAKAAADASAQAEAEVKAEKIKAGEKIPEEPKKVWNHRAVRHKQTMPAAPSLEKTR